MTRIVTKFLNLIFLGEKNLTKNIFILIYQLFLKVFLKVNYT